MDKVKQKLLDDFKRSNKTRKEKLAIKYGFNNSIEYLEYLENKAIIEALTSLPITKEELVKPIIHNVVLLDATGSMEGSKYNNSKKGIIKELEWIKTQTSVNYTCTLIEFIEEARNTNVKFHHHFIVRDPNEAVYDFIGARGGDTPLYKAVLDVINLISSKVNPEDKVLLKVYTDGQNNTLSSFCTECLLKIKEVQSKNFTVTFVGTNKDLERITKDLKLELSNCLSVENTGKGFEKAFEESFAATNNYTNRVLAGEDVSTGFYKSIIS